MRQSANRFFLMVMAVTLLAACAATPVQVPTTLKQQLAFVDSQVTTVALTAGDLREQGILSNSDYDNAVEMLLDASDALDAAWAAVSAGDAAEAQLSMQAANTLLLNIRSLLLEAQK